MTPTPNTPPRSSSPGAATSPPALLPAGGAFPMSDDMRPIDEICALKSVAECHDWRKRNGDMDSMTYLTLLMRIDALRKLEVGNA